MAVAPIKNVGTSRPAAASDDAPEPSPSPGPAPTPPEKTPSNPSDDVIPIDPPGDTGKVDPPGDAEKIDPSSLIRIDSPEGASEAFQEHVYDMRCVFQKLLNTLGDRRFNVELPDISDPPEHRLRKPAGFAGETQAAHTDLDSILRGRSGAWSGTPQAAVALATEAATVGGQTRDYVMFMVDTIRDAFAATDLHQTRQAAYHSSTPGNDELPILASYKELLTLIAADECLYNASIAVLNAQQGLGMAADIPLNPTTPQLPRDGFPPVYPTPRLGQRFGPGAMQA